MTNLVVDGALLMCSMGTAPCSFSLHTRTVNGENHNAATIMDHTTTNVPTFVMCTSMANPAVAGALGVPQACTPQLPAPWVPGKPDILMENIPALDASSILMCAYAGVITVSDPGEHTIMLS